MNKTQPAPLSFEQEDSISAGEIAIFNHLIIKANEKLTAVALRKCMRGSRSEKMQA